MRNREKPIKQITESQEDYDRRLNQFLRQGWWDTRYLED